MGSNLQAHRQLDAIGRKRLQQLFKLHNLPKELIELRSTAVALPVEPLLTTHRAYNRLIDAPNFKYGFDLALQASKLESDEVIKGNKGSGFDSHFDFPFANLATCFLIRLWPAGLNKCRIASSVVMSFGCFFFFGIR
jgi:hypothetical protein